MGLYSVDLDKLSAYNNTPVEKLKEKSYAELEKMEKEMNRKKFLEQNKKNAEDEEYERIVVKYFEPIAFLRNWFTEREIVLACANLGITERSLCSEMTVEPGHKCWRDNAEYLRTSVEPVPQYDKQGNELMERKRKTMDVYRVASRYQSTCHGDVIKKLLYGRYPELEEFGFSAYGMSCGERVYEIYPKNNVYVGFTSLMTGNVDAILDRNRRYCKWYNNGRYSPDECEKAFREEGVRKMFDVIHSIGAKEKALGHSPICEQGGRVFIDDMDFGGEADGIKLFVTKEKTDNIHQFVLVWDKEFPTVEQFLSAYAELIKGKAAGTQFYAYLETDYLGETGKYMSGNKPGCAAKDFDAVIKYITLGRKDVYVSGCYGIIKCGIANLTIRIKE